MLAYHHHHHHARLTGCRCDSVLDSSWPFDRRTSLYARFQELTQV